MEPVCCSGALVKCGICKGNGLGQRIFSLAGNHGDQVKASGQGSGSADYRNSREYGYKPRHESSPKLCRAKQRSC